MREEQSEHAPVITQEHYMENFTERTEYTLDDAVADCVGG